MTTFYMREHDLSKVQLAMFGGDLTERIVEAPNKDWLSVIDWGSKFLKAAHKANTAVLLLEGTHSHDRGQPAAWVSLAPEGMDFRYVDTISIQFYPELDNLSVLCVPDNLGPMTTDEVWERALELLREHKLEQVDIIAFHSGFDFQLPPQVRHKTHNPERWESIVKYYILSGHIHVPVERGKIRCSGSFDRTGHGQEHPKGGYVVDIDLKKETSTATFWENKRALPYVTMRVKDGITPEELVENLHQFIKDKKLPPHAQVRLMDGPALVVNPIIAVFQREYPMLGFKADNSKAAEMLVGEEVYEQDPYVGCELTPNNLSDSLIKEIAAALEKDGIPDDEAKTVLKDFL